ncbi:hypothetical protein FQN57_001733 [Myotisia sp. PD_48]|nr:hypothetical protein FQN57_001733 [Myotisia sp. PD_48]
MAGKRKLPPTSTDPPSGKRSRPLSLQDDGEQPSSTLASRFSHQQPRNDPIFGQKHAFPGLDDEVDGHTLCYGPPEDGLEYLRMVRSEARTLPSLFVAEGKSPFSPAKLHEQTNCSDQKEADTTSLASVGQRWVYSDGVYAAVSSTPVKPVRLDRAAEHSEQDSQEQYYNLLRHRFLLLRSTLKCVPPAARIAALDSSHPISLPANSRLARAEWVQLVRSVEPQMVQLASMDTGSVLRVLRIVTRSLSEAAKNFRCLWVNRIAAWAWGLLGRCREVGEMTSEEVSELRDLGKRAGRILAKIREKEARDMEAAVNGGNPPMAARMPSDYSDVQPPEDENDDEEDEEEPEESFEDNVENDTFDTTSVAPVEAGELETNNTINDEDDLNGTNELEAARARLEQSFMSMVEVEEDTKLLGPPTALVGESTHTDDGLETKLEIRAMLDMILTIVGEFYGQLDLLELRDIWDEK